MDVLLRASAISLFLTLVSIDVVSAQSIDAPATDSATVLTIGGDVAKSIDLSIADLVKLPHSKFSHSGPGKNEGAEFDGILLSALLALAGVESGDNLWERWSDAYLLVESADGNHVVFSLPEIDSSSGGHNVILALRRDGQMLDDSEGPLQIVNSSGSRKARWVKHVRKMTVVRVKTAS